MLGSVCNRLRNCEEHLTNRLLFTYAYPPREKKERGFGGFSTVNLALMLLSRMQRMTADSQLLKTVFIPLIYIYRVLIKEAVEARAFDISHISFSVRQSHCIHITLYPNAFLCFPAIFMK